MKFLRLRLIWAIIRGRPVIANCEFNGGFILVSENGYIFNNITTNDRAEYHCLMCDIEIPDNGMVCDECWQKEKCKLGIGNELL